MTKRVPVWKKDVPGPFKLKEFIHRHNKALTITGAIIVFLTFTVKEELRDKARESGETSRLGVASYFLEQQLAPINVQLRQILLESNISAKRLLGVNPAQISQSSYTDRIGIDGAILQSLVMRGGAMVFSIKEVPDEERRPDAIAAAKLVDTAADEAKKLGNIQTVQGATDSPELKAVEEKMKELENDADKIGSKVIADVEEHELSMEESYEGLDFLSYVLYFVGWGLALIGRLYEHAEQELAE